jgi:RES domain-containing protein
MLVYRIDRKKYLKDTLKGIGASMSSSFRWNSEHTRMVYTSESRALALLEITAHLNGVMEIPTDRYLVEIEIPDALKIQTLYITDLPKNWNAHPPSVFTQNLGDSFVQKLKAPVLKVPSSIVPQEFNLLINPHHPDANKIQMISKECLAFDPRIVR